MKVAMILSVSAGGTSAPIAPIMRDLQYQSSQARHSHRRDSTECGLPSLTRIHQ